jgi:hypothetical protein
VINVCFSSVTFFQPKEANGYVVQAQDIETGTWYYHPGPPRSPFFTYQEAHDLSKKVALKGAIDETLWWRDWPSSDFESAERKNLV